MSCLSIGLVHHPVLNKNGEVIGSAVTNLDLHDIARAAKTYGVDKYYVATPYGEQQELVREIVDHWQNGHGATYNPARKEALSLIRLVSSVDAAIKDLREVYGQRPLVVTTSAKVHANSISYTGLRKTLVDGKPVLMLLGTAHGLAPEIMQMADAILEPIELNTSYNHLSVRTAAAIMLDRLLGS